MIEIIGTIDIVKCPDCKKDLEIFCYMHMAYCKFCRVFFAFK